MCYRFTALLLALTTAGLLNNNSVAGILSTSDFGNGDVAIDVDLEISGTTYELTFIEGSYNTVTASGVDLTADPWFTDDSSDTTLADQLMNSMKTELEGYIGPWQNTASKWDSNPLYAFAIHNDTVQDVAGVRYGAVYDPGGDSNYYTQPHSSKLQDTVLNGLRLFFATTRNSTVPEPSTAIAMGLLGIVGFAGNRRRRRQELVA